MKIFSILLFLMFFCTEVQSKNKYFDDAFLEVYLGERKISLNPIVAIGQLDHCLIEQKLSKTTFVEIEYQELPDLGRVLKDKLAAYNKDSKHQFEIDAKPEFSDELLSDKSFYNDKHEISKKYFKFIKRFKVSKNQFSDEDLGVELDIPILSTGNNMDSHLQKFFVEEVLIRHDPPLVNSKMNSVSFGVGFEATAGRTHFNLSVGDIGVNFNKSRTISEKVTIYELARRLLARMTLDKALGARCTEQVLTRDTQVAAYFPLEKKLYKGGVCIKESLINKGVRLILETIPSKPEVGSDDVLGFGKCGVESDFKPKTIKHTFKENQQCVTLGYFNKREIEGVKRTFKNEFGQNPSYVRVTAYNQAYLNLGCLHYPIEFVTANKE
jgi:hypothetical protein